MTPNTVKNIWYGAKYKAGDNNFVTSMGMSIGGNVWALGEPINDNGECVRLDANDNQCFVDLCTRKYPFVCQMFGEN